MLQSAIFQAAVEHDTAAIEEHHVGSATSSTKLRHRFTTEFVSTWIRV